MKYECVTDIPSIKNYLQNASVVGFDFETAPLIQYRNDPRASLDAHRACIVGVWDNGSSLGAVYGIDCIRKL